jgi:hypothetical protein
LQLGWFDCGWLRDFDGPLAVRAADLLASQFILDIAFPRTNTADLDGHAEKLYWSNLIEYLPRLT